MASKVKKKTAAKKRTEKATKKNPPAMRPVKGSGTGWMSATAVKIVKRRGRPDEVLIRKPAKKRKK